MKDSRIIFVLVMLCSSHAWAQDNQEQPVLQTFRYEPGVLLQLDAHKADEGDGEINIRRARLGLGIRDSEGSKKVKIVAKYADDNALELHRAYLRASPHGYNLEIGGIGFDYGLQGSTSRYDLVAPARAMMFTKPYSYLKGANIHKSFGLIGASSHYSQDENNDHHYGLRIFTKVKADFAKIHFGLNTVGSNYKDAERVQVSNDPFDTDDSLLAYSDKATKDRNYITENAFVFESHVWQTEWQQRSLTVSENRKLQISGGYTQWRYYYGDGNYKLSKKKGKITLKQDSDSFGVEPFVRLESQTFSEALRASREAVTAGVNFHTGEGEKISLALGAVRSQDLTATGEGTNKTVLLRYGFDTP